MINPGWKASYARADVYARFVAQYLRLKGWTVEQIPRGDGPDQGDLRLTRNGRTEVMDVKEAKQWVRTPGQLCPWEYLGLTSADQLHPEWSYAVVAHDFHMIAFAMPSLCADDDFKVKKNTKKTETDQREYDWVLLHRDKFKFVQIHISGRPAK